MFLISSTKAWSRSWLKSWPSKTNRALKHKHKNDLWCVASAVLHTHNIISSRKAWSPSWLKSWPSKSNQVLYHHTLYSSLFMIHHASRSCEHDIFKLQDQTKSSKLNWKWWSSKSCKLNWVSYKFDQKKKKVELTTFWLCIRGCILSLFKKAFPPISTLTFKAHVCIKDQRWVIRVSFGAWFVILEKMRMQKISVSKTLVVNLPILCSLMHIWTLNISVTNNYV